jgi:hypothetical protein
MTKEDIKYLKSIGLTPNDVEIYQDGGVTQQTTQSKPNEQEQIMQIIQIYAQLTQVKPEQIIKQLQSAKPEDQQKMLQQMVMQIQEYKKQNSGQNEQEMMNNSQEDMQEPQMKCGGKIKKKMYESGGLQNYYKSESGNVEAENNEHVLTPDGKSFELNGKTHSEGGIDLNLPSQSLIFSEKIKAPKEVIAKILNKEVDKLTKSEKKYSFADIANKYSTEKDFEKIKNVKDDYSKKAIELNITKKLPKLQEIFESQERYKFGLGMENDYENLLEIKQNLQNPEIVEVNEKIYAQKGKRINTSKKTDNFNPISFYETNPGFNYYQDYKANNYGSQKINNTGRYGEVDNINLNQDNLKLAYDYYYKNDAKRIPFYNLSVTDQQKFYNKLYNTNFDFNPDPSSMYDNAWGNRSNSLRFKNNYINGNINKSLLLKDWINMNDENKKSYADTQGVTIDDINQKFNENKSLQLIFQQPFDLPEVVITAKRSNNTNDSPIINPSTNYDQLKSTILDYNPIINANKKATLNNLLGNINEVNYPIMLRRPPLRSLNEGYDLAKMNNIALNKNYADSVYQTANSSLSEVDKQAINSENYAENLKASYNNIPSTTKYFNDLQNSNRGVTFTNESNQYNYDRQALPRYEQQLGTVQKGLYQSKKENMDTINKYYNFNADFKMRMNDQQMINDLIDNGDGTYTYTPNKDFIIQNQADLNFIKSLHGKPKEYVDNAIEWYKILQKK